MRGSDTVSRQGGDEFVVLLSEVDEPRDVTVMVKRMLRTIAEPHSIKPHELHITASIGVSDYPGDGEDAETLIKNADTAMYQAKEDGRQGFRFFKPIMNVRAVERQSIEESLRRALERNEFALHYQPKVDLRTGKISGAEALLRWMHPTRGLVSPVQFVPVAEECGLIVPIGSWVLKEACRQARLWLDAGLPLKGMAVNVSAVEFHGEKLLERIFAVLANTGLDPKYLELELTESLLLTNADVMFSILQELREMGVKLAIDDFGTGYSSLSYLRHFQVNRLKIDRSFVRDVAVNRDGAAITTAIIEMAKALNLEVLAEGVENEAQLSFLRAQHCYEVQGFYFSKPVDVGKIAELMRIAIIRPA